VIRSVRCLFSNKKNGRAHFYGSPIDSEHDDDYPAGSGFVFMMALSKPI